MSNSGRWAVKCPAEALEQISDLSPACAGDVCAWGKRTEGRITTNSFANIVQGADVWHCVRN